MSDDIKTLTARLAEEPTSLAFLELGEALRRRGQLDAAYKVARGGLTRYPGLAEAHDLLGRILGDQGDLAGAFDAWVEALRLDPMRTSALKGIAFLYFRAGDVPAAMEHLQRAAEIDPDDQSVAQALLRVQHGNHSGRAGMPPTPVQSGGSTLTSEGAADESQADTAVIDSPFSPEAEDQGLMLVDGNGLRLSGNLRSPNDE